MQTQIQKPGIGIGRSQKIAFHFWDLTDRMTKKLLVDTYDKRLNRMEGYALISTIVMVSLKEFKGTIDIDSVESRYIEFLYYEFITLPENKDVEITELSEKFQMLFVNRTMLYQKELSDCFLDQNSASLPFKSCYLLFFSPLTSANRSVDLEDDLRQLAIVHLENISYVIDFISDEMTHLVESL